MADDTIARPSITVELEWSAVIEDARARRRRIVEGVLAVMLVAAALIWLFA